MKIYTHNNLPTALLAEHNGEWFILGGIVQKCWRDRTPIPAPLPQQIEPAYICNASFLRIHGDLPKE